MPESISVVIPCYNSAAYVAESVESALAQTYRPLEVIVVDDGSTDATEAVLKRFSSSVRYIQQENAGPAAARNRGVSEARGEWIAFLDSDDCWVPEKLARQVECFELHPDAALVHADTYFWDVATGLRTRRERGREQYTGQCYAKLFCDGNVICTSTVIVRRTCINEVGGFDQRMLHASTEDYDLWLRLARHHSFAYVPEPLTLYRLHADNSSADLLRIMDTELYVLEKALREDLTLVEQVGWRAARRRLSSLCFDIGYEHFEQGDFAAAHTRFGKALGYRSWRPRAAALWLATMLPPRAVNNARRMKQRLSTTARRSDLPT